MCRERCACLIRANARRLCARLPHQLARYFLPICGFGNSFDGISHMVGVESSKNPIPVLRISNIIALTQSRQIGMALNGKSMSLVTAVMSLQYETITLSTIMHQFTTNKWCAVFSDQQVNRAGATGQQQNSQYAQIKYFHRISFHYSKMCENIITPLWMAMPNRVMKPTLVPNACASLCRRRARRMPPARPWTIPVPVFRSWC